MYYVGCEHPLCKNRIDATGFAFLFKDRWWIPSILIVTPVKEDLIELWKQTQQIYYTDILYG